MENHVGQNLKAFRKKKNLTLSELSERCGLSVSYLSLLERDMNNPTLSSIQSICSALDVSLAELFSDDSKNRFVIHKEDRQKLFSAHDTVLYYSLSDNSWPIRIFTMEILDKSEHISYKHPFAEVGIVRSGSMVMTVDGNSAEIFEGDTMCIQAGQNHQFHRSSDEICISAWIQMHDPDKKDSIDPTGQM